MSNVNDMGYEERINFESVMPGEYDAVIHAVIGLGLHATEYQGKPRQPAIFIKVVYEIPGEIREDGQTQVIGQRIKLSTNDKSNCYKFLFNVHGNKVTKQTITSFINSEGLKKLLGKPVSILVSTFEKEDREIAYVEQVRSLDPRLPPPVAKRDYIFFNPLNPDLDIFKEYITNNTRQQIMSSLNMSQFPKELHKVWVELQENNIDKDEGNDAFNTEAIE